LENNLGWQTSHLCAFPGRFAVGASNYAFCTSILASVHPFLAPGQLVLAIDRTIIEFAHEFGLRARRLSDLQNDLGGGALNSEVGYRFERFENGFTRITPIARIQLAPIRGIRVEAV
jgi:hypothetical protein